MTHKGTVTHVDNVTHLEKQEALTLHAGNVTYMRTGDVTYVDNAICTVIIVIYVTWAVLHIRRSVKTSEETSQKSS